MTHGALPMATETRTTDQKARVSLPTPLTKKELAGCLHAWSRGVLVGYCAELAAYHQEGKTRDATTGQKHARPLLWAERERAGGFYFEKK